MTTSRNYFVGCFFIIWSNWSPKELQSVFVDGNQTITDKYMFELELSTELLLSEISKLHI